MTLAMKVGRNDPCTCGSGKKFKKCCGFNTSATAEVSAPVDQTKLHLENLGIQLARFAPTVTSAEVIEKIRTALKSASKPSPVAVIEELFSDDNLDLKNKKQADRLFKAFMSVWNDMAVNESGDAA